jgi:hypothetical protein
MSASVLAESLLERWPGDPVLFWKDVADEDVLRPEQEDVLRSVAESERVALRAGRGWGKTTCAAACALWFLATRPGSLVIVACPSDRQTLSFFVEVRRLFNLSRLRLLHPDWTITGSGIQTDRPEWRMVGMSSNDPALLEGLHAERVMLIADESKSLPDDYFTSLVGSCASAREWRILCTGTGGAPSGFFFRAFGAQRSMWKTHTYRLEDSPHLHEVAESERERLGADDPAFRQLYGAEFTATGSWSMFTLDAIERAIGKDPDQEDDNLGVWKFKQRTFGVDLARTTDDSVICRLVGRRVESFEVLPKGDEMQTAGLVVAAARRWRAREIVLDEGGLGHGVMARVAEVFESERHVSAADRVTVLGLNSSWQADDPARFFNRKTELMTALRKMLLDGVLGLPKEGSERLIGEMLGVQLKMTSTGKMQSVDPRKSPDFLDSMICALHARVMDDTPQALVWNVPGA